jgi:hypothetical protein
VGKRGLGAGEQAMSETLDTYTTLRCSSLDSLVACTPSVVTPEGFTRAEQQGDDATEKGRAVHALLASYVESGRFDIKAECVRRGLDDQEEDISRLVYAGLKQFDHYRRHFPDGQTAVEQRVRGDIIAVRGRRWRIEGATDVLSKPKPRRVVFLDWKTGYKEGGYVHQQTGYAYAAWCEMGRPADAEIIGILCWLRHGYAVRTVYTPASLTEWETDLCKNVLGQADTFRPGGQCNLCPVRYSCDAAKQRVAATMQALAVPAYLPADDPEVLASRKAVDILAALTPDNKGEPEVALAVGNVLSMRKLAYRYLETLDQVIRETVERVGPIPLGDGHELRARKVSLRVLDADKAIPIARRVGMSDGEIAGATRLSRPKLLAIHAGKFVRGEKRAAREALEQALDAGGAVSVTEQVRLEEAETNSEVISDE